MRRVLLGLVLSAASLCLASDSGDARLWTPPNPLTYEGLRAWYAAGGLPDERWPRERHVDLNGDGEPEVFLGIEAYSRGIGYALFHHTRTGWHLLAERVEGSHHDFDVLPARHRGWHDFQSTLPSGRGGILEFVYTWDGKSYVEKSSREITEKELLGK